MNIVPGISITFESEGTTTKTHVWFTVVVHMDMAL